jgi:hypothetical protein
MNERLANRGVLVNCGILPFANDPYAEKYDDLPKMAYHRPHRTVEHLIPVFRCPTERSIGDIDYLLARE